MRRSSGTDSGDDMARKLKTYQTSLGFFDLAIAAPSMKAALAAWGASSNLFHQGAAKEADDPRVIAAAMAKPGVVLKRPVGSSGRFEEHADVPSDLPGRKAKVRGDKPHKKRGGSSPRKVIPDAATRKAAAGFEREERRREKERAREEAIAAKRRKQRDAASAKAQAAVEKAQREHDKRAAAIENARAEVEKRWDAEQARWDRQRKQLMDALHRARNQ